MIRFCPTKAVLMGLLSTAPLVACATAKPSQQLVDARKTYEDARIGMAAQLAPAHLHEARKALAAAERENHDDPGSWEEQSLAYIAKRKAQYATLEGDREHSRRIKQDADSKYRMLADQQLQSMRDRERLASEQERVERAEASTKAAIATLQEIAKVQEDQGNTVITVPSQILFASGSTNLLPIAQEKLSGLAEALKQDEQLMVTVKGYSDSRGSARVNQRVSEQRAEAVRSYLIGQGVEPERVKAMGEGENDPVAPNTTADGRANNRRVVLVVEQPEKAKDKAQKRPRPST